MALGLFPQMTAACALLTLATPAFAEQTNAEDPAIDAPLVVRAAAAQERAMRPLPPVEIGAPPPVPPPASPGPVPGGWQSRVLR